MDSNKNNTKKIILITALVLAITFLGIFFIIKSMFSNINGDPEDESAIIREHITNTLVSENKRLLLPEGDFTLSRGDSLVFSIGLRNDKAVPLNYKFNITSLDGNPNQNWFVYINGTFKLNASEVHVRNIRINVPPDYIKNGNTYSKPDNYVADGNYSFKLEIFDIDASPPNNIYAQDDLIIIVKSELEE